MKYLIVLLFVFSCDTTTSDISVSQLQSDVNDLKKAVTNLNSLQLKLQSDATVSKSDIESMKTSIASINKLLTSIQTRVDNIALPDTVYAKQYIGNGNLIYHEASGSDTVNIVMNDSVSFKIWKTGSEIIKK